MAQNIAINKNYQRLLVKEISRDLFVVYVSDYLLSIYQPAITCSKLTIETLEQDVKCWGRSGVFIVNFEHILLLVQVFLLLNLSS